METETVSNQIATDLPESVVSSTEKIQEPIPTEVNGNKDEPEQSHSPQIVMSESPILTPGRAGLFLILVIC